MFFVPNNIFVAVVIATLPVMWSFANEFPPGFIPKWTTGDGACYNQNTHACSCAEDVCSEEKCLANNMMWTGGCNSIGNCTECEACPDSGCPSAPTSPPTVSAGPTTLESVKDGCCYDTTLHVVGCGEDRCNKDLCAGLGFVWTKRCSSGFCTECAADDYVTYVSSEEGLGACLDGESKACGCGRYECTKEKCEEKDSDRFTWSVSCPISCDADTCPKEDADCKNSVLSHIRSGINRLTV